MKNENPRRGENTARAEAVDQSKQRQSTTPPISFQSCVTPLDWALAYVRLGWYVLPLHSMRNGRCSCGKRDCPSPAKHPIGRLVPNGFKDASNDPATIEEWWRQEPDANIGVATGQSGLTVLDVDSPDGKAQLKHEGGTLSPTLVSRTGREDGYHLWYRGAVPSSQVKGEHLDVRGTTGYVVAPGSVHATGRVYHWANPECPIADVPDWVGPWVASRGGKAARPTEPPSDFSNLGDRPSYLGDVEAPSLADRALAGFHEPWTAHAEARLRSALAAIPANLDGKTWHSYGAAIHDLEWPNGLDLWDDWSKTSKGDGKGNGEYRGRQDLERRWVSFGKTYTGPRVTVASIFRMAKQYGWCDAAEPKFDGAGDERTSEQGDQQKDQVKGWRDTAFSAAELRMMTFEPVRYVLPRFIPEGMTLLVGRPKVENHGGCSTYVWHAQPAIPLLGHYSRFRATSFILRLKMVSDGCNVDLISSCLHLAVSGPIN
jgi:Bifunctional DNA primase/polymerase, N-terminal/Primase C terminal 2 (PriCT-2)